MNVHTSPVTSPSPALKVGDVGLPFTVYDPTDFSEKLAKPDTYLLDVEWLGLTGFLIYKPKYLFMAAHVEFYATSEGWDWLTSTGYRSFFLPHERPTNNEIIEWFEAACKHDCPELKRPENQLALF